MYVSMEEEDDNDGDVDADVNGDDKDEAFLIDSFNIFRRLMKMSLFFYGLVWKY